MRLNFSGIGVDDIREGMRRLGEVVRELVELYGTLTGAVSGSRARRDPMAPLPTPTPPATSPGAEATVLQLRRKRA